MYTIVEKTNGEFLCLCQIQDGTERWIEKSKENAIYSLIKAARVLNGSYITRTDIDIEVEPFGSGQSVFCHEDLKLLDDIKTGRKVVLDYDDKRIKYRITQDECETILQLREGTLSAYVPTERLAEIQCDRNDIHLGAEDGY